MNNKKILRVINDLLVFLSILNYTNAGESFKGALEDECNLNGIPAVTCEVLSPIGVADLKSSERSLTQMFSFLKYFKIL